MSSLPMTLFRGWVLVAIVWGAYWAQRLLVMDATCYEEAGALQCPNTLGETVTLPIASPMQVSLVILGPPLLLLFFGGSLLWGLKQLLEPND